MVAVDSAVDGEVEVAVVAAVVEPKRATPIAVKINPKIKIISPVQAKVQRQEIIQITNQNHTKEAKGPLQTFQTMPVPVTGPKVEMRPTVVTLSTAAGYILLPQGHEKSASSVSLLKMKIINFSIHFTATSISCFNLTI